MSLINLLSHSAYAPSTDVTRLRDLAATGVRALSCIVRITSLVSLIASPIALYAGCQTNSALYFVSSAGLLVIGYDSFKIGSNLSHLADMTQLIGETYFCDSQKRFKMPDLTQGTLVFRCISPIFDLVSKSLEMKLERFRHMEQEREKRNKW
jgi:hypothetical protein